MLECLSKVFSEHVPDVASTGAEIHQFFMRNKGGPGTAVRNARRVGRGEDCGEEKRRRKLRRIGLLGEPTKKSHEYMEGQMEKGDKLKSEGGEAAKSKGRKTPKRSEALSYDEELHDGLGGDDDGGSQLDKESIWKRALTLRVTLTLRKLLY